jgi:hypothetical protein
MILYHFTRKKFLPSITERGLVPNVGNGATHLTLGIPVVWLTADGNTLRWLDWFHEDSCRLTVQPKKKRLVHWQTWLREREAKIVSADGTQGRETGTDVLARLEQEWLERSKAFYVYLGTIPPRRITEIVGIKWTGENDEAAAALRDHQKSLKQLPDKTTSITPNLHATPRVFGLRQSGDLPR